MLSAGAYYGYDRLQPNGDGLAYETADAHVTDIVSTAVATGTLEPVVKVLVGSQVSGTVVQWYADFNQEVTQGFVLAELDQDLIKATVDQRSAALAVAVARVQESDARVTESQLELDRIERAYKVNGASDFERDKTRATVAATQATQRAAQSQQAAADAELRAAQIQFEKTIIRSPIDGIVISRDVDAGQTVAASLSAPTLFTIANDLRNMRVSAAVSETDIGRISEGMSTTFRVDAYPAKQFSGVVSQIRYAETVVDNVVTYETLIDVENPELLLRPGMTATITFEIARADEVLAVPNAALRFDPQHKPQAVHWRPGRAEPMQQRVFKLNGVEGLVEVPVVLGLNDGSMTQVLSGDLAAGDIVVTGLDPQSTPPSSGRRRSRLF
jgi:HlyD family secretion protein